MVLQSACGAFKKVGQPEELKCHITYFYHRLGYREPWSIKASNAAASQGTAKHGRRLTASGDQDLEVNSGTFRGPSGTCACIRGAIAPGRRSILTAKRQLQGSARSKIEERCLFDDMPRASQWAGTWHSLPSSVLTIASEDSTSAAFHVAVSTRTAGHCSASS